MCLNPVFAQNFDTSSQSQPQYFSQTHSRKSIHSYCVDKSQLPAFNFEMRVFGLHRDEEEDLVDYDDSDIETGTRDNITSSAGDVTGELDLDIYSNCTPKPGSPAEERAGGDQNEEAQKQPVELSKGMGISTPPATKTPQAATLIKGLQNLLADSAFQTSLGLKTPGDTLDLSFWANGFDYALILKLTRAAEVKACRHGASCYNAGCTFDHGGANRTAIVATGKSRKLCTMINTPQGCLKGDDCWFSHEVAGVACLHGDSRKTCAKGPYCFYKHDDDAEMAPVDGPAQESPEPVTESKQIGKVDTTADPLLAAKTRPDRDVSKVPSASAEVPAALKKLQVEGRKRGCDTEDEYKERNKARRVEKRQGHRKQRRGSRSDLHEPLSSSNPKQTHRDSDQTCRVYQGGNRGRGRGINNAAHHQRQHAGDSERRGGSLRSRMTRQ